MTGRTQSILSPKGEIIHISFSGEILCFLFEGFPPLLPFSLLFPAQLKLLSCSDLQSIGNLWL